MLDRTETPGAITPWTAINQLLTNDERFFVKSDAWQGYLFAPKSVSRLSALIYLLQQQQLDYTIQGKGSQRERVFKQIIVSSRPFTQIEWLEDDIIAVEAGCSLRHLQSELLKNKQELGWEDWIGETTNRSVGGAIVNGSQSGLVLNQLSIEKRLLGVEIITPDGGIIRLGRPLKSATAGPALHRLFWGIKQTNCLVIKAYFRTTPLPAVRWPLVWSFQDQGKLWRHLNALQSFCSSWERLDCIIPGITHEKSFILAQISGSADELNDFKSDCPGFSEASHENRMPVLKHYLVQQKLHFNSVKSMLKLQPGEYIWHHCLTHQYWFLAPYSLRAEQEVPIWKKRLWEAWSGCDK